MVSRTIAAIGMSPSPKSRMGRQIIAHGFNRGFVTK
jgi:hypothetical protein